MIGAAKAILSTVDGGGIPPAPDLSGYLTPTYLGYMSPNGTYTTPQITANVTGGVEPYTYVWSVDNPNMSLTSNGNDFTGVTAGGYNEVFFGFITCTITDNAATVIELSSTITISFGTIR